MHLLRSDDVLARRDVRALRTGPLPLPACPGTSEARAGPEGLAAQARTLIDRGRSPHPEGRRSVSARIEDLALIGDTRGAALVSRDGSIDWLCLPRFDSGASFAALLGTPEHGRFLIAPEGEIREVDRRYRGDTLILETDLRTDQGEVRLVDLMPVSADPPAVVRIVRGVSGRVRMRGELGSRVHYGSVVPLVPRGE